VTDNVAKTSKFFNSWNDYVRLATTLDTYQFSARMLEGELAGCVLDIGNGGVINYDLQPLDRVVVVDIAPAVGEKLQNLGKVFFQCGDALALPAAAETFDTVLLQQLIHHLAEKQAAETESRARKACAEAYRALRPGGKVVIMESCLPKAWEKLERLLFPFFCVFLNTIGHPLVFQWNWESISSFLADAGFVQIETTHCPLGKWIIHFGIKWPTALTPACLCKITARKPG
jgi:SAM-dependent methyltransferase